MCDSSRNLIFISTLPITIKIKELFFLDIFEKNGYNVIYWGLHKCFTPDLHLPDEIYDDKIQYFNSLEEFQEALYPYRIHDTIILSSIDDNFTYRKIFKIFINSGFLFTTIFPYGGIYGFQYKLNEKIKRIFSSNVFKKIGGGIKNNYYNYYKKINHIDLDKYFFSSNNRAFFAINHPDYENYKKIINKDISIINNPYIVFLDTNFPLHQDLEKFNALKYAKPDNYYSSLREFFEYLENKFGMEVVIAAHPKSDYSSGQFGNRKIIKYKTDILVKNSEMVLTHMSNSTAYAILFDKITVFISTSEMEKIPKFAFQLRTYAKHLNKKVYNIDEDASKIDFTKIEDSFRNDYIYKYLTSPETENKSTAEILIREYDILFEGLKSR